MPASRYQNEVLDGGAALRVGRELAEAFVPASDLRGVLSAGGRDGGGEAQEQVRRRQRAGRRRGLKITSPPRREVMQ